MLDGLYDKLIKLRHIFKKKKYKLSYIILIKVHSYKTYIHNTNICYGNNDKLNLILSY